jgi:hypothetical protein
MVPLVTLVLGANRDFRVKLAPLEKLVPLVKLALKAQLEKLVTLE